MRLKDLLPIDYTEGSKSTWNGQEFQIVRGIPRQLKRLTEDASHTQATYDYMWHNDRDYGSEAHIDYSRQSLRKDYPGYQDLIARLFATPKSTFLDLGCGSGFGAYAFLGSNLSRLDYIGAELSASVELAGRFFRAKAWMVSSCRLTSRTCPSGMILPTPSCARASFSTPIMSTIQSALLRACSNPMAWHSSTAIGQLHR